MRQKNQPSVYVSTYAKYNNSNLSGKWINLCECSSYADFVQKCKEAHKDEAYPELMIQDYEYFPDGLACDEWISESEFVDIVKEYLISIKYQIIDYSEKAIAVLGDTKIIKDQLKNLGGRFNAHLNCGAGWIFPKTKLEALKALLNCDVEAVNVKSSEHDYKESLLEFAKNKKNSNYYTKEYIGAIKINNNYMLFSKLGIKNKFCFSDEGPEYDYYNELMEDKDKLRNYFLAENLKSINHKLDNIRSDKPAYLCKDIINGTLYLSIPKDYQSCDGVLASADQKNEIAKALEYCKDEFEKRLKTYLKKYDTSKLKIWTYWADR